LLPARARVRQVKHRAGLPYDELSDFVAALRARQAIAARALEFLVLTATRTGDVLGARPSEIKDKVWTVPAERMNGGKEHRMPLSAPALAIVEAMKEFEPLRARHGSSVHTGRILASNDHWSETVPHSL
jgi:integrase